MYVFQIVKELAVFKQRPVERPVSQAFAARGSGFFLRGQDGGAREDRTPDLLRARQALSQLSYGPWCLVGLGGFEPPTSPLSGVRSDQLSYRPVFVAGSRPRGVGPTALMEDQAMVWTRAGRNGRAL